MKKYINAIFLILIMCCTLPVSAETIQTYSDIVAYRYDENKGYIMFNALSELNDYYNNYGTDAKYEVAFWKVTNNDGTSILQDGEGNQIINIGTNDFEIIDAKRGIFAVGSSLSGCEDIDDEVDYAKFEGNFNIYNKDGMVIVSNVYKYNRLKSSNIALIQTNSGAYFFFDTDTLAVTRNLNYDKVEVFDYEYVKVTNYGRYSWENKVGLFNANGKMIVSAKYQSIDVWPSYICATDKNWNDIYFDFEGNILNKQGGDSQMVGKYHYVVTDHSANNKSLYHIEKGLVCELPDDVSHVDSVYSDGFMIARADNSLYGILDKSGSWITQPQYQSLGRLADGQQGSGDICIYNPDYTETMNYQFYIAKNDSGYGIIDANNKIMQEFAATAISYNSGAYSQNGLFAFDKDGNLVTLTIPDSRTYPELDFSGIFVEESTGKYLTCTGGVINLSGYELLGNAGKHHIAKLNEKMAVIDYNGNIVISYSDLNISYRTLNGKGFYQTSRTVAGKNGLNNVFYGAYSEDGKELLSCNYTAINSNTHVSESYYQDYSECDRYVIVAEDADGNEKYGFIDGDFNIICDAKYDYLELYLDRTAVVGITKTIPNADGRYKKTYTAYGMIDVNGNEILPCQYYEIVNGPSRIIVADYEFTTCNYEWAPPVIISRWCVADKNGNFIGSWKNCDMPNKYNRNCLHCSSLLGTAFNEQGYAVVGWSRSHDSEYIYDSYAWEVIIDKDGNYVTNPFWHGHLGDITTTLCDEGTFAQYDSDEFYVRSGDVIFNKKGSWKWWDFGDKLRFDSSGSYGFVEPMSQKLQVMYDSAKDDLTEKERYVKWNLIKVNKKSYYYVDTSAYKECTKIIDDNGNVVINGNATDINRRYIKVDGVFMDNPLLSGETLPDIDKALSANYYSKSKSYSFKIKDFAKTKYDDNHFFTVELGDAVETTDKTGRTKITPENKNITDVRITGDGYFPLNIPAKFLQSYYNNFYMYKTDYSTEPVVHAVFYNNSNIYKPDRSSDVTYYSGNTTQECVITPILNTNGNNIQSVKIVQGNREIEITNKSLTNVEIKNNKTYALWIGESIAFKPGMDMPEIGMPIYLIITTKTGTQTKIQLQLKCIKNMDEEIDVDLGDEVNFSSDEEHDQILGDMSFKYKMFDKLPADFKLTPVGDGNYAFKATLGVESKDKENIYETMDDYFTAAKRDAFDEQEYGGKNPVQKFDNFFKKLQDENIASKDNLPSAELGKTCAVKLFGYLEGSYDLQDDNSYKLAVTDGGMSAKFSFDNEVQRQTIINGVPCYWTAGFGLSAAVTVPLYSTENGLYIPDSVDGEFDITVEGGGGVGVVDVVTLGASGEGKLAVSCTIPLKKETTQAILSGKINLFDYQLGILQGSILTLETPELQLYPEVKVIDKKSMPKKQLSREYADGALVFNVESVQLTGIDEGKLNINHSVVADNTYTFTKPQIVELDENRFLGVWIEDERTRESDSDRTAVYYSVCEDGVWSEPKIVNDDTTADFNPKLKKVNGNVYLIWANATENFAADESDTAKIARSLVTSIGKWTGTGFELYDDIDNKGVILSDITEVNGIPVVTWIENASGDLRQSESTTTLRSAEYNNSSWIIKELLTNQKAIDGLATVEENGALSIYYSQDVDGDISTSTDKEIFNYKNYMIYSITDNDAADTKPYITDDYLYWYSDSKIAYMNLKDTAINYIEADCMSDTFNVSQNNEIVTYSKKNIDGKQAVYAVCKANGTWGKPIELVTADKYIVSHDITVDSNGALFIICNEVEMSDTSFGKASLDLYKIVQYGDLTVKNLTYNEYSMNGDKLRILCDLTNNGFKEVKAVNVKTFNDDGVQLYEADEIIKILPGETVPYSVDVPASKTSEVFVEITAMNFEDSNIADNKGKINVCLNDISLENIELVEIDNRFMISAMVFNRGLEDLSNVNVTLRKGSKNGEVVEAITVRDIAVNDFEQIDFVIDSEFSNQVLYVVCENLENENIYGNNSDFVKIPNLNKEVLKGDILSDGVVNAKDAVKLAQYLAKWDITLTDGERQAADVVADGVINSKDAVKLAQYLAKWDITLD